MDKSFREKAACKTADPNLFYLIDDDHPHFVELVKTHNDPRDGSFKEELEEIQEANFHKAFRFCHSCPVRQECYDSASNKDKHYTVRGGKFPEGYDVDHAGRPQRRPRPTFKKVVLNGTDRMEMARKAADFYQDGATIRQISFHLCLTYAMTRNLLHEIGIDIRPRGGSVKGRGYGTLEG